MKLCLEPGKAVFEAACRKFGPENVRWDFQPAKGSAPDFPVQPKEGPIASSMAMSEPLNHLPTAAFDYVFVSPAVCDKASKWLDSHRTDILNPKEENQHGPTR